MGFEQYLTEQDKTRIKALMSHMEEVDVSINHFMYKVFGSIYTERVNHDNN